jgi:hypothetical protein
MTGGKEKDDERLTKRSTPAASELVNTVGEPIQGPPTRCLGFLFLFTSFGYMLPWTSLGSLISYYKATYGANFYVLIYFCYYLPGLPVSIFQHFCGESFDSKFGSFNAYLFRGILFFSAMITILLLMINCDTKVILYVLFILLGISGWACHGTASGLAAMHGASEIAMLQTGFRCPEIFAIVVVFTLHIGRSSDMSAVNALYVVTSIAVLTGMISWICTCVAHESRECFDAKDMRLQNYDVAEAAPLLAEAKHAGSFKPTIQRNDSSLWLDDDDVDAEAGLLAIDMDPDDSSDNFVPHTTRSNEASCLDAVTGATSSKHGKTDLFDKYKLAGKRSGENQESDSKHNAVAIVDHQPLWMLCAALIITIYCSIFQAAFFAYVNSQNGWEIEQVLYFTRLFSDLAGRPLTMLPRPSFMKVGLVTVSVHVCNACIHCRRTFPCS